MLIALKLAVSAGLLSIVLSKAGIREIGAILRGIDPFLFLLACLIYAGSIYISAVRWGLLLPPGFETGRLFSLYLIGAFFNNILPGIIGGDAVKAYYLNSVIKRQDSGQDEGRHSSVSVSIASVFMDRYVGFTALMAMGMVAYPFGLRYFRDSFVEWLLPLIAAAFIAGSILVIWLKVGRRFKLMAELYDYFSLYHSQAVVIAKTLSLSLFVQVASVLAVFIISRSLGIIVPLLPLFVFIPIISTLTTLPVSISGVGVREASFVLLLGFLGISPTQATAISFSWFLSVVAGSLPGLYEYIRFRELGRSSGIGR